MRSFNHLTLPAPVPPNFFVGTSLRNRWSSLDVIAAMLVDLEQKNFDFFSLDRQHGRPVLVFCCLWGLCENHLFFHNSIYAAYGGLGELWYTHFVYLFNYLLYFIDFVLYYDLVYRKKGLHFERTFGLSKPRAVSI